MLRYIKWNEEKDQSLVIKDSITEYKRQISELEQIISRREQSVRKSSDADKLLEIPSAVIALTKVQREKILRLHNEIYKLDLKLIQLNQLTPKDNNKQKDTTTES